MPAKKPSEVTRSPFWKEVYALQEEAEANRPSFNFFGERMTDLQEKLQRLFGDLENKFDSIPEPLQRGKTGVLIDERREAVADVISALDNIEDTYDGPDSDADRQEWVSEQWQEAVEALNGISCD